MSRKYDSRTMLGFGELHLDDDIGLLLLRVNVCVEVRLAGLDRRLDALQGVPALRHVALDLPCELDLSRARTRRLVSLPPITALALAQGCDAGPALLRATGTAAACLPHIHDTTLSSKVPGCHLI